MGCDFVGSSPGFYSDWEMHGLYQKFGLDWPASSLHFMLEQLVCHGSYSFGFLADKIVLWWLLVRRALELLCHRPS